MKTITVKIPVSFKPFLQMADNLIKAHGYKDENRVEVAKHQSAIHQDEAFEKALQLIKFSPGYTVAVEPMELIGEETVIYHATIYIAHGVEEGMTPPEKLLEHLKTKVKPEDIKID